MHMALKIPLGAHRGGNCPCWDFNNADRMKCEAQTVGFLCQNVPGLLIPPVLAYDTSFTNAFGVPFMLTRFVSGKPATELWKMKGGIIREIFLRNLVQLTMQLDRCSFHVPGYPVYGQDGTFVGVKALSFFPKIEVDHPLGIPSEDEIRVGLLGRLAHNVPSPINDAGRNRVREGAIRYLRKLVEWTPVYGPEVGDTRSPCVLSHPDLDLQNIMVDDLGKITALIDWDGVRLVHRCVGNESYPLFLLEDLQPERYRWRPAAGPFGPHNPDNQDSPEECAFWRGRWEQMVCDHFENPEEQLIVRKRVRCSVFLRLLEFYRWQDGEGAVKFATGVLERTLSGCGITMAQWTCLYPGQENVLPEQTVTLLDGQTVLLHLGGGRATERHYQLLRRCLEQSMGL